MFLFKRFDITSKILFLVALLLVLLSAVSLAGYAVSKENRRKLAHVYSGYIMPAVTIQDAKAIAIQDRHLVMYALTRRSPKELEILTARVQENQEKIEALSPCYMSGNFSAAEKRCADELKKLRQEVFEKQDEVLAAAKGNADRRELMRRLSEGGDIAALENKYLVTADKFSKLWVHRTDRNINHAASSADRGAVRVAALSLVALLTGILLTLIVSRSIAAPLSKMHSTVSSFAKGRFDCVVEAGGEDEIAKIGECLQEMADNLQRTAVSARRMSRDMSDMAHEFSVLVRETNASARELNINSNDMRACLSEVVVNGMEIGGLLGDRSEARREVVMAVRQMMEKASEAARAGERVRHGVSESAAIAEYLLKGADDLSRFSNDLERVLSFFQTEDVSPGRLCRENAQGKRFADADDVDEMCTVAFN